MRPGPIQWFSIEERVATILRLIREFKPKVSVACDEDQHPNILKSLTQT